MQAAEQGRIQVMERRAERVPCGNLHADVLRLVRLADAGERGGVGEVELPAQLGPLQRLRVLGDLEQVVNDLVAHRRRNLRSGRPDMLDLDVRERLVGADHLGGDR